MSKIPEDIRERIANGEFSTETAEYMTDEERSDALLREQEMSEDLWDELAEQREEMSAQQGRYQKDTLAPNVNKKDQLNALYNKIKNIDDLKMPDMSDNEYSKDFDNGFE